MDQVIVKRLIDRQLLKRALKESYRHAGVTALQGLRAEIDWASWERPAVFGWLDEQGVSEDEQRRVFNLGIGMCAVVPESDAGAGLVIGRLA